MIARSKQIVKIDYFVELHYAFETGRAPSLLNNRLKTPEKNSVCNRAAGDVLPPDLSLAEEVVK